MASDQNINSVPSVNLDLQNSGTSQAPFTRNTDSNLGSVASQGSSASSGGSSFVDIQNRRGNLPHGTSLRSYPSVTTEDLAEDLNINYRPVQESTAQDSAPLSLTEACATDSHYMNKSAETSCSTESSYDFISSLPGRLHQFSNLNLVSQNNVGNDTRHGQTSKMSQCSEQSGNNHQLDFGSLSNPMRSHDYCSPVERQDASREGAKLQPDAIPSDDYSCNSNPQDAGQHFKEPRSPDLKETPHVKDPGIATFTVHGIEVKSDVVIPDSSNVHFNITNTDRLQIGSHNTMVINQPGSAGSTSMTLTPGSLGSPSSKRKVALQVPKRPVDDGDMHTVAEHLGRDWRRLGRELGFTSGQLDNVASNYRDSGQQEIVYQMMRKWWDSQDNPETASIKVLVLALVAIKRSDVAEMFQDVKKK